MNQTPETHQCSMSDQVEEVLSRLRTMRSCNPTMEWVRWTLSILISVAIAVFAYWITQSQEALESRSAGNMAEQREDLDEAIRHYSQSIILRPDWAWTYNARALVYNKQGHREDAIQDLDKAIELEPESPYLFSNRGSIKLESEDCDGAIADLKKALSLFGPHDPEARMELKRARNKCGER